MPADLIRRFERGNDAVLYDASNAFASRLRNGEHRRRNFRQSFGRSADPQLQRADRECEGKGDPRQCGLLRQPGESHPALFLHGLQVNGLERDHFVRSLAVSLPLLEASQIVQTRPGDRLRHRPALPRHER